MLMSEHKEEIILAGKKAIDLWLKGKKAWNQWVDNNRDAQVNFEGVNFGELRQRNNKKVVSFQDYHFPNGEIDFSYTRFGKRYVNFFNARFGEGRVNFSDVWFGEGNVNFYEAQFGEGDVNFSDARFGEGNVIFANAQFGEGKIRFHSITKGVGVFVFAFNNLKSCKELDMSNSTIDSILNISGTNSPVPLNLTHTKLAFPIDIDNVNINYRWRSHYFVFRRALNSSDSTSFRRLKKLANDAADHERALDFYAKEMRTGYWHFITGPKLALYYLYDCISDYGRSIVRPILGLIGTSWVCKEVYLAFALKSEDASWNAVKFSVGHIFSIYPGVRETRKSAINVLFGEDFACAPWWLPIVTTSQYVVSTALLFLLGLALRNRFRS